MAIMRMYRLEHRKTGLGPWAHPGNVGDWVKPLGAIPVSNYVSKTKLAYSSLEAMLRWAGNEDIRQGAKKDGFVLRIYVAHPRLINGDQVHLNWSAKPIDEVELV